MVYLFLPFYEKRIDFLSTTFWSLMEREKKFLHPICSLAKYINALSKHIPRRSCQINFYKYAFFALILFLSFNYWYLSLKNKTKRKKVYNNNNKKEHKIYISPVFNLPELGVFFVFLVFIFFFLS